MTLKEDKVQSGEGEKYCRIQIECDLCGLMMYYNEITDVRPTLASQTGIYICSNCARKILIQNLKI